MANKEITGETSPTANASETLTVRLPSEVLAMLDELVKQKLFSSRSEAIREFCREYVLENKQNGQNKQYSGNNSGGGSR